VLKIQSIAIKENTERPVTAEIGANEVVGTDADKIVEFSKKALGGHWKESGVPDLRDGRASERIVKIFAADTSAGSVQVYTDKHGSDKKRKI